MTVRATILGVLCLLTGCDSVSSCGSTLQPAGPSATSESEEAVCDGEPKDCVALGTQYLTGEGALTQDHKKAARLFEMGCDGGNATGCHNLAVMVDTGQGVAQNSGRAVELFERACKAGNSADCAVAGNRYLTGSSGAIQDQRRARTLFTSACEGGDPVGCGNLATMYYHGAAGLSEDKAKAVQLFMKACLGDDRAACLGRMLFLGDGGLDVGEACILDVFQRIDFKKPKTGKTMVSYSLRFTPK